MIYEFYEQNYLEHLGFYLSFFEQIPLSSWNMLTFVFIEEVFLWNSAQHTELLHNEPKSLLSFEFSAAILKSKVNVFFETYCFHYCWLNFNMVTSFFIHVLSLNLLKFSFTLWFKSIYRKVASSNTSQLGLFRLLMKGILDPYVLWPFDKKLIS